MMPTLPPWIYIISEDIVFRFRNGTGSEHLGDGHERYPVAVQQVTYVYVWLDAETSDPRSPANHQQK